MLESGKQVLFGLAAAAVGTSISIGAMLNKAVGTSLALAHFEAETGLSAQTLQEWQHVGEALGLTADEVTSSIGGLNDQLARVRLTGQGAAPYSMLGINPLEMENAWDVLEELRKVIASGKVPPQLMSSLIKQMGLSASMVKVLKLTNKEFDIMSNRGAIISKDQIEKALKFNAALKRIGQTITYLFTVAFAELAPEIIEMLDSLMGWIQKNKGDLIKGITEAVGFWGNLAKDIATAFGVIDKVIKRTVGWENAIKSMVAAFVLLNPVLTLLWAMAEVLLQIDYFLNSSGSAWSKVGGFLRGESPGMTGKVAGLGFKSGLRIGEEVFKPVHFFSPKNKEGILLKEILRMDKPLPGLPTDGRPTTNNTTINISSNATDNGEVANILVKELGRAYAHP